ncbi:MAG TPA: hypothetical protein PLC54_07465, partial [Spirochaetales bacterium]|nr:hypothetical protein [Spirochaetales bacterium]
MLLEAGHPAHSLAPYEAWDAHNYLQLRWSEPVNLGISAGFTIADPTAANVRAMASFTNASEYGGYASGSGSIAVAGYVSLLGTLDVRSRDPLAASDIQATALYRGVPNAYGVHGLYISVAGYSFAADGTRFWPGYIESATSPSGTPVSVANPYLTDASGNVLEPSVDTALPIPGARAGAQYESYPKIAIGFSGAWDTEKPTVEITDGDYDVVPYVITGGETRIERFEIRFDKPVRDSSFTYPSASADILSTTAPAFEFGLDADSFRYGGSVFSTDTQSAYLGASVLRDDDLASIVLAAPELREDWTVTSQLYFRYSQANGRITDLAGNLMQDYSGLNACIERVPPRIRLASAIEGGNRIYVAFTEPVKTDIDTTVFTLNPTQFVLSNSDTPSLAVSAVTIGATDTYGILDAYLTVS